MVGFGFSLDEPFAGEDEGGISLHNGHVHLCIGHVFGDIMCGVRGADDDSSFAGETIGIVIVDGVCDCAFESTTLDLFGRCPVWRYGSLVTRPNGQHEVFGLPYLRS